MLFSQLCETGLLYVASFNGDMFQFRTAAQACHVFGMVVSIPRFLGCHQVTFICVPLPDGLEAKHKVEWRLIHRIWEGQ